MSYIKNMCANHRLDVLMVPCPDGFFFTTPPLQRVHEEPNMAIVFGYVPCGSQGCRFEEAMDDVVSYFMNLNESVAFW